MAKHDPNIPIADTTQLWDDNLVFKLQRRLNRMLCAYVFAETPPYGYDSEGNVNHAMLNSNGYLGRALRGEWFTDIIADDVQADVMGQLRSVLQRVDAASGRTGESSMSAQFATSKRLSMKLPITDEQIQQFAPHWVATGAHANRDGALFIHTQNIHSQLPVDPDMQSAGGLGMHGLASYRPGISRGTGVTLAPSARGRRVHEERIEELAGWAIRTATRLEQAVTVSLLFQFLCTKPLGITALFESLPWFKDALLMLFPEVLNHTRFATKREPLTLEVMVREYYGTTLTADKTLATLPALGNSVLAVLVQAQAMLGAWGASGKPTAPGYYTLVSLPAWYETPSWLTSLYAASHVQASMRAVIEDATLGVCTVDLDAEIKP